MWFVWGQSVAHVNSQVVIVLRGPISHKWSHSQAWSHPPHFNVASYQVTLISCPSGLKTWWIKDKSAQATGLFRPPAAPMPQQPSKSVKEHFPEFLQCHKVTGMMQTNLFVLSKLKPIRQNILNEWRLLKISRQLMFEGNKCGCTHVNRVLYIKEKRFIISIDIVCCIDPHRLNRLSPHCHSSQMLLVTTDYARQTRDGVITSIYNSIKSPPSWRGLRSIPKCRN